LAAIMLAFLFSSATRRGESFFGRLRPALRPQIVLAVANVLLLTACASLYWNGSRLSAPLSLAAPASAQPAEVVGADPDADGFVPRSIVAAVAQRVSPAVATVGAIRTHREMVPTLSRDFFLHYSSREVSERVPYLGSGALASASGLIVTNHHVVEQGESFFVTFPDGREFPAELVAADPYIDLALLKIEPDALPEPIPLGDSDDLQIGETAIALGNPFGPLIDDPRPTVTAGVVSALGRSFRPDLRSEKVYQDMIQTDAAINPGNSGGPLVDAQGRMIGVNTFIFSGSGGSIGLGFAIPINRVRKIIEEIETFGRSRQLWLDFDFATLRDRRGAYAGVGVARIRPNGPAQRAGLQEGDLILKADGRSVSTAQEFSLHFKGKLVGDMLRLTLWRDGEQIEAEYIVSEPPQK
jgi:serine protease Do